MPNRPPRVPTGKGVRTKEHAKAYGEAIGKLYGKWVYTDTPKEENPDTTKFGVLKGGRSKFRPDKFALDELSPASGNAANQVPRGTSDADRNHPPCPDNLPRKSDIPEWREQANLVQWIKLQMPYTRKHIMTIGNEGPKTAAQHNIANMMGRRVGASDIFLSRPSMGFNGLFLEMKEARRYTPSERSTNTWRAQIEFIEDQRLAGYAAHFVFGMDHGITLVKAYFGIMD